jgi:hypothetical protein
MTDLATERAAVMEKRDQQKAEALLRARVRHCRQLMVEPRTSLQMAAPKSIEEAARRLFPELPEHELAEIIAAANEPEDRGRTVQTIATSVVKDLTRKFLEANRDASARDAWQHVLKHGQPTFQESSFPAFVSGIRKDLGISMGSGPKPKSDGPLPSRSRARQRDQVPAVSKQERAARLKAKRAAVEASAEAPAPKKNGKTPRKLPTTAVAQRVPEASAPAQVPLGEPALITRVAIDIGGETIEARRREGGWTVDVGDGAADWFLRRMLAGAGR